MFRKRSETHLYIKSNNLTFQLWKTTNPHSNLKPIARIQFQYAGHEEKNTY